MCAQVLRSVVHNYPSCANMIWEKIRDNVLDLLQVQSFEDQKCDANFGPPGPKEESTVKGRCLMAGIKVMLSPNVYVLVGRHVNLLRYWFIACPFVLYHILILLCISKV